LILTIKIQLQDIINWSKLWKTEQLEGLGCSIDALNKFIKGGTRFPFEYSTESNPGACYVHFRRVFQSVCRVRMTPVNGGHRAWAMNRIMSCYGLRSPFPMQYFLKPWIRETSSLCLPCLVETLYLSNFKDIPLVRNFSRELGMKDSYTTDFTTVTFMNDIFDKIEEELMLSIQELVKRDGEEGFSNDMKNILNEHYKSLPKDFSYIGNETLGENLRDEPFPNILHVLKWVIYKSYRCLPRIKNDEAKCNTEEAKKMLEIINRENPSCERFPLTIKNFGYNDKTCPITVKSTLVAKVSLLFVTRQPFETFLMVLLLTVQQ
jgi:hypothetical protein